MIAAPIPPLDMTSNTEALGQVLYTRYVYFFEAAGLILLVSMIGAIVLTLQHKPDVRRQKHRCPGRAHPRRRQSRSAKSVRARDYDLVAARAPAVSHGAGSPASHAWREGTGMTIGFGHYLVVAAILFTLGIFGIFLNRRNVIVILMSIELILLAVNINLVAFSAFLGDLVGQVFASSVLTVAAAEAATGLAILVVFYRNRGSIAVEDINLMKG